jgi:hypothetical protein
LKAVKLCERINLLIHEAVARHLLGEVFYEIGEYQSSKENFCRTVDLVERSGSYCFSWLPTAKTGFEMAKVRLNEGDVDLESLSVHIRENKLRVFESWSNRFMAALLLNMDDLYLTEAEKWIQRGIRAAKRDGMMWALARAYTLYGEFFKRKGEMPKAKENLIKAIQTFGECGADGWVRRTEKKLDSLS